LLCERVNIIPHSEMIRRNDAVRKRGSAENGPNKLGPAPGSAILATASNL
jgi:hypothetical protein